MIRISKSTRLKPEEIIAKAENFFGESGEHLDEKDRTPCCIYFAGSWGYLSITVVEERQKRTVDVETREFEYQAKRFIQAL